jgi:hypothetical protein
MDERHLLDRGVIGRVEAMIHARRQPQREEAAVAVLIDQRGIAEQIEQRVRRALDLKQFSIGDPAVRADDAVGRAGHDGWIGIGRAQAGPQFARKTIVQAFEFGLFGFRQIEIGKQPPARDRGIADKGVLDLAEPAHEARHRRPRDAVGQQEIQILLLRETGDQAPDCHQSVSRIG